MRVDELRFGPAIPPELLFFLLAIVAIAAFSRPIIVRRPGLQF